jgi:hypothetical protein
MTGQLSAGSREGKKFIGGYFDQAVARDLKIIAAKEGDTIQGLIGEAIDLLMASRKKAKNTRLIEKQSASGEG